MVLYEKNTIPSHTFPQSNTNKISSYVSLTYTVAKPNQMSKKLLWRLLLMSDMKSTESEAFTVYKTYP